MCAWNYHGSVTDTDLTQVSLLFFLDKCRSIYLLHVGSSRRLSPGIWMVRSQMLLLTNFEQGFLASCSLGGYPKCWILRYSQKYGCRKENVLVLSDLWVADRAGVLKVESDCTAAVSSPSSCSWQIAVMSSPSPPCQCQLGRDLWMPPQALRLKELGGSCTHSSAVTCKDKNPLHREWTNGSSIGYG